MPLLPNEKNKTKVLTPFLHPGEGVQYSVASSGWKRELIALTEKDRVVILAFPRLGKARLLLEFSVSMVDAVEFLTDDTAHHFVITYRRETRIFKVPMDFFHSLDSVLGLYREILARVPHSRPPYLDEGETESLVLKTDRGGLKISDRAIHWLDWDLKTGGSSLLKSWNSGNLKAWDSYPGNLTANHLRIQDSEGNHDFKISLNMASQGSFGQEKWLGTNQFLGDLLFKKLQSIPQFPLPGYLEQEEQVSHSTRGGKGALSITQKLIFRLTDRRLLVLEWEKEAGMQLKEAFVLADIQDFRLTRVTNNGTTAAHVVKFRYGDSKFEYSLDPNGKGLVDSLKSLLFG